MPNRICLFSPYVPDLGGGGTNLRTLVPELAPLEIDWCYTAPGVSSFPGTARVGGPMAGGTPVHDLSRVLALWAGIPTRGLTAVVAALTARGRGRFWVVGHNEGILVARALARAGHRVHLTIQDDVPDGMMGRSQRYRLLPPFVRPRYYSTLRRMASIDVTSDGMQTYYRDRLGLSTVVVHPYVPSLPVATPPPPLREQLHVGHIGSIYDVAELRTILEALQTVAAERGLTAKMTMVGLAAKYRPVAEEYGPLVEVVSDLPEHEAVRRLFGCHFLYAMYPFDERSAVFRRTSLPTKLTTYLRCQRPILGHSPAGSSLLDILARYGIGTGCTEPSVPAAVAAVRRILEQDVKPEAFERARSEVYGIDNVERLRRCLEAL